MVVVDIVLLEGTLVAKDDQALHYVKYLTGSIGRSSSSSSSNSGSSSSSRSRKHGLTRGGHGNSSTSLCEVPDC